MKRHVRLKRDLLVLSVCLLAWLVPGNIVAQVPEIYVDGKGVMRWSDTRKEASFFGVNYTLPFAHAYRAMGYLGVDRKSAIDRDVYHLARLGINAYRIHLWDVELSDGEGNLLENEHLDLMDYLIYKLQERGIRTLITLQTNFGNGYPERDEPTGGYTYRYEKCTVHRDADAIAAQERYAAGLMRHVNPYTGNAYKDEPFIVGFEVNNEPCHTGTVDETRRYIDRMVGALRGAGCKKPLFYNVSHNGQVVEAYYATSVQGTTYQWYPIGLVSGYTRRGNFLPFVDSYRIPFSHLKGFDKKARLVYEFDPADILYTYMYPATVRTFRAAGFQWMTQFAYDPIDMAAYNTEYQTHYLNVSYTPGKAVGLMIAAEVAQAVGRGESFGTYPADTLFRDFRVSYAQDLSELNNGELFYYSNTTQTQPKDAVRLRAIAGCGSSPVVRYEGTGIYWIDRLDEGVWRLEVMPDVVQAGDPFAKPSLDKEVMRIIDGTWDMQLALPDLGKQFRVTGLNAGNHYEAAATDGVIRSLRPGTYLLRREGTMDVACRWQPDTRWKNIRLGEYVQPAPHPSDAALPAADFIVNHTPARSVDAGRDLVIEATVAGVSIPDSVILYTDRISFWNKTNPYIKMQRTSGYRYRAVVPAREVQEGCFRYNITVCAADRRQTFPAGVARSPLDWDYTATAYWETEVVPADRLLPLFETTGSRSEGLEVYTLPSWSRADRRLVENAPAEKPTLHVTFQSREAQPVFFLQRYIREEVVHRTDRLAACRTLCLHLKQLPRGLQAGFVCANGYTYLGDCPVPGADGIVRLPLTGLKQVDTALLPYAFPDFLDKYFHPSTLLPFRVEEVEKLELRFGGNAGEEADIEVGSIWLE